MMSHEPALTRDRYAPVSSRIRAAGRKCPTLPTMTPTGWSKARALVVTGSMSTASGVGQVRPEGLQPRGAAQQRLPVEHHDRVVVHVAEPRVPGHVAGSV